MCSRSGMRALLILVFGVSMADSLRADQTADEAAIRKAAETYVAAYNQHDAKALAAHWSSRAVYSNPLTDEQVVGREAIEAEFAAIFAEMPDARLQADVESVQFLSPNVAIEQGTAHVIRPDAEPEVLTYTALHIRENGKWLMDRVSEEPIPVVYSNYERLKSLEWMIGTWVDEDESARIEFTCQWTQNQSFITRKFSIAVADRIEMSGMQIVGWDPVAGKIRSWVFDSDGGFGQATWTHKDNRWVIDAASTLPDGRRASAINIMTKVDDDSFTWESTGREVDGEILPNVDPVKVVRAPAAE